MDTVVFLTEGGRSIGFGHIYRCLSLAQEFDQYGVEPVFIISSDEDLTHIVKPYKVINADWIGNVEKVSDLVNEKTVVVIDSYLAPQKVYEKIRMRAKTGIYFDDTNRIIYPEGFVVNGQIHATDLDYPDLPERIYFLGLKYQVLRKEFKNIPDRVIKDTIESIMITFGGDDLRSLTRPVLKLLCEKYPNLKKYVVVGGSFHDKLADFSCENVVFYHNADAETMKNLMLSSDIAISAAGQTLYEFAVCGTPTIAIRVADNQEGNIKGLQDSGYVEYAGKWDDRNLIDKILFAMDRMQENDKRRRIINAGSQEIDGKGSGRIVSLILKQSLYRKRIIIATIKTWNIENAVKFSEKYGNQWDIKIISEKDDFTPTFVEKYKPDFIFIPHWSWKIPRDIHLKWECIVFHMTDLPFGRGGSPLQNLIVRKIKETKISAIKVTEEVDAGDVYFKEEFIIGNGNADSILSEVSDLIFDKMIPEFMKREIIPKKQEGKVTNFKRRTPEESDVEKADIASEEELYDFIRMLDGEGYPQAFLKFGEFKLLLSDAKFENGKLSGSWEVRFE